MEGYTLMVLSDDNSPVRRFRVPGRWITRLAWTLGVLSILGTTLVWDYARKWTASAELLARTQEFESAVAEQKRVSLALEQLEGKLTRVYEFERKLRVIADLPADTHLESDSSLAEEPNEGEVRFHGTAGGLPVVVPVADRSEGRDTMRQGQTSFSGVRERSEGERFGSQEASLVVRLGELDGRALWRANSLENLISKLEAKHKRLASMPAIWPAQGWLTSRFGPRRSPFTGRMQRHQGIDIAAPFGTPIIAPGAGRVTFVGRRGPMGNALVIDHGDGVETLYGHAKEIHVRSGQKVERGDLIAQIGDSGRSTGPHLHYAVEIAGVPRDPMGYILD